VHTCIARHFDARVYKFSRQNRNSAVGSNALTKRLSG